MSYIATKIGTIPSAGFCWYILYLEGKVPWNDRIRKELEENFVNLGREVGPKTLVVRGYTPESFSGETQATYKLQLAESELPALLVTDTAPLTIHQNEEELERVKLITIPLT